MSYIQKLKDKRMEKYEEYQRWKITLKELEKWTNKQDQYRAGAILILKKEKEK